MDGIRQTKALCKFILVIGLPATLSGCLLGEGTEADATLAEDVDVQITGSVGDGPIAGAAMQIVANDGSILAEFDSSATASFDVGVTAKGDEFPLSITATGGTDLVTNLAPDFLLRGAVLDPTREAVANVTPFSTMAIELAADMSGGADKSNIVAAEGIVVSRFNFGLNSFLGVGPMRTQVDAGNVADIVRASEALGETIRRTRDWLASAGVNVTGDQVLRAIASDLTDEVIDGRGGSRVDARIAAVASVVAAQVSLETMANELHVNNVDATAAMADAIQTAMPTASQSLDELTPTAPMLYQAQIGIAAAARATGATELDDLLVTALGLQAGLEVSLVRNLLPNNYRQTLDAALALIANGSNGMIDAVNTAVRSGDLNPGANGAPTISGTPPGAVQVNTPYSFTPTSADPDGDTLTFSAANLPGWASISAATGQVTGTPAVGDVGSYTGITITVSDGTDSATLGPFSITVTMEPVTNRPPTISGTPPASVDVAAVYSFAPTAADPDGDTLTFTAGNLPAWLTLNNQTGAISGTPQATDVGAYNGITIVVSDGAASATLGPFSITVNAVTPPNTPPTISGTPPATVQANSPYAFTPTASDVDGDTLTFSVQNLPPWATFNANSGALGGTPGDGDVNTYSGIVISVSDGASNASLDPFSITVEAVNLGSASLAWDAPTLNTDGSPRTDLAGYRVYWGQGGNFPNSVTINNPGVTSYLVEGLAPGTWQFRTTAFSSSGVESDFSNVASKDVQP